MNITIDDFTAAVELMGGKVTRTPSYYHANVTATFPNYPGPRGPIKVEVDAMGLNVTPGGPTTFARAGFWTHVRLTGHSNEVHLFGEGCRSDYPDGTVPWKKFMLEFYELFGKTEWWWQQ